METKDQPTQPDRVAARMPTAAGAAEPDAAKNAAAKPAHTTQLIGTPIVSVSRAVTPTQPIPVPSDALLRPEPPTGVVEGVTFVEPRIDPGNDSELDSVILSPSVSAERAALEAEARRATTVRTRTRRRGKADGEAMGEPSATRRSATLLVVLVAIALLLTGVSSLFRSVKGADAEAPPNEKPDEAQPRVDVQAASPQRQAQEHAAAERSAREPTPPDVPAPNAAALPAEQLLPPPEVAVPPPAVAVDSVEKEAATEVVSVHSRDSSAKTPSARPLSPSPSTPREAQPKARVAPKESTQFAGSAQTPPTLPAEGKSWIKVRE